MKIYKIFTLTFLVLSVQLHAGFLLDVLKKDGKLRVVNTPNNDKTELLERTQEEFNKLREEHITYAKTLQQKIASINRQLLDAKSSLRNARSEDNAQYEFLTRKVALLQEIYQMLLNLQLSRGQVIATLEKLVKLLKEYVNDTEFKFLMPEAKTVYTMRDFQVASKRVTDQEDQIKHLVDQKNDALSEVENFKKKLSIALKSYNDVKKEQEDFANQSLSVEKDKNTKLDIKQSGQLLDLDVQLANWGRELAEARVDAAKRNVALLETSIFIETEKAKKLRNFVSKIRDLLRVDPSEIKIAESERDKDRETSVAQRNAYYAEIKKLTERREQLKKELDALGKAYSVPTTDVREAVEWDLSIGSVEQYASQCAIGLKNEQILLIDRKIDYLQAQIELEKVQLKRTEVGVDILNSWSKIKQRRFKDNEELAQETKGYRDLAAEMSRDANSLKDKRTAISNVLNIKSKALANLKEIKDELAQKKGTLFKQQISQHGVCVDQLNEAEKIIAEQIEVISKLIEVYSNLITVSTGIGRDSQSIISELDIKSMWKRSQYAISWHGVKHIFPDIQQFFKDVSHLAKLFFEGLTLRSVWARIWAVVSNFGTFFILLLSMLLIFGVYKLLQRSLPQVSTYLLSVSPEYTGLVRIARMCAGVVGFIWNYLPSLYTWFVLFLLVHFEYISDPFLRIVFYLCSIPFWLYLIPRFIEYFLRFNRAHGYLIFHQAFEHRFKLVLSIFGYLTAIVILFREAFILAMVHKSELPTILLAGYSVFLRALVIFSIGKDEVLAMLPTRSVWWQWIGEKIDRYYYWLIGLIIVIMIISDPYVGGYRNLVSYLLWGIIGSGLLIWVIYLLQIYLKNASSTIFLQNDEEIVRERFAHAKTWYGLFTILISMTLITIGIFIGAKIWGFPLMFENIIAWFNNFELFATGQFDKETGKFIYFTPGKFVILVAIICSSFVVAALFSRFVLRRIFEVLPVDSGIQNTVISISRYLIVVIAILSAFLWAGLGTHLLALGVVVGSIGYILKEPIGDFISYFIVLVQRPVEIGQYIQLSDEIQGVVRQITPRSIILRRKDSYTIIVPNSMVISQPVNNWNYARNFVAFDDIHIVIPFNVDPVQVRELIAQVLDENINILKSPRPVIRLDEFGEYGYVFMIRGFITDKNMLNKWDIASDVRFGIAKALHKAGIKIAVPTRLLVNGKSEAYYTDDVNKKQ